MDSITAGTFLLNLKAPKLSVGGAFQILIPKSSESIYLSACYLKTRKTFSCSMKNP